MITEQELRCRPRNAPHLIRSSLLKYIRHEFAYAQDWMHPLTRRVYSYADVCRALEHYKALDQDRYKALWLLWHTGRSRSWIAENFCYSASSIRRRWDKALDSILVFLDFPHLQPNDLLPIYAQNED